MNDCAAIRIPSAANDDPLLHQSSQKWVPLWNTLLVLYQTFLFCLLAMLPQLAMGQEMPSIVREIELQGSFESLIGDRLTLVDADGKRHEMIIQVDPAKPVALSGGNVALSEPARIRVIGNVDTGLLREGMVVRGEVPVSATAKTGALKSLRILDSQIRLTGLEFTTEPTGDDKADATIVGQIKSVNSKRLVLKIPRHETVPRETIAINIDGFAGTQIETRLLSLVKKGDVVKRVNAVDLSNGDTIVRLIDIELSGQRSDLKLTADQQLQLKHWKLSNQKGEPREFRSQHFLLMTDVSDRSAQVLLDKLETMFESLADYYKKQPATMIECFVVDDIGKWNTRDWDARVIRKVKAREGITMYARQGRNQKAVVFSASNDDVVQHEAVHGFCFLAFSGTGPLWYAEGMAELGKYWQADSRAVNADPAIIGYLTSREPKPLNEIIEAEKIEGEVWRAYAWRWSLCHFLAHNPNYARDFKRIGIPLMRETQKRAFEKTFGGKSEELTFEYLHFMKHLEAGLRADLCAWNWDAKARNVRGNRPLTKKVNAARGWQPMAVRVKAGENYKIVAEGTWKTNTEESSACNADGRSDGTGRLIAVVMDDFMLSEEFELGTDMTFTAPKDGELYVRCRERMSQIADNSGELQVAISKGD